MKPSPDQDKVRTLRIALRYFQAQKIADSDVRWLLTRSERLVVADRLALEGGYEIEPEHTHYQPPLGE